MGDNTNRAEVAAPAPAVGNVWTLTVVCVMAWMIPGLGHYLLKRPKLGTVFFIAITLLFFWGLALGAKIYHYEAQQPLTFFALFAQAGMGIPYFFARFIAAYSMSHPDALFHDFAESFQFGRGQIQSVTFEYGNTFTIVAGLLNLLVVLDAYDIAVGRKGKQNE